jgi:hypothetical protein
MPLMTPPISAGTEGVEESRLRTSGRDGVRRLATEDNPSRRLLHWCRNGDSGCARVVPAAEPDPTGSVAGMAAILKAAARIVGSGVKAEPATVAVLAAGLWTVADGSEAIAEAITVPVRSIPVIRRLARSCRSVAE